MALDVYIKAHAQGAALSRRRIFLVGDAALAFAGLLICGWLAQRLSIDAVTPPYVVDVRAQADTDEVPLLLPPEPSCGGDWLDSGDEDYRDYE